ncbi:DNA methylase [Cellulophaga phage phi12:1]|uniref:DNA methylase n=2 Tax=Cellulophaga phage phi12:1 TaxID=1327976 RepID=R9ZZP2_9CAUD|nr:DNA methyltransferase [Cellulophaga phage phi12:1]AGO48005.1 DNA methylase [Cellulophaga phage phi12:1]AGO48170.1 DNA methylase [Cellulophaga phage phi12:3]
MNDRIKILNKLADEIKSLPVLVIGTHNQNILEGSDDKYGLIFIDGDHSAEQVEKDIVNAWKALNPGGAIAINNCKPYTKEMQTMPRMQSQWTGDTWRAVEGFKKEYPAIRTEDLGGKYGMIAIHKTKRKGKTPKIGFIDNESTYEEMRAIWDKED